MIQPKILSLLTLKVGDFYKDLHNQIYEIMLNLLQEGKTIDVVNINNAYKMKYNSDGIFSYLTTLTTIAPSPYNYKEYEKIIKERKYIRDIYKNTLVIKHKIENNEIDDLDEYIQKMSSEHFKPVQDFKQSLINAWDKLFSENQQKIIKTGMPDIDEKFSFCRGSLNIIACRPSLGKTAFATQLAYRFLQNNNYVLFLSLEMSLTEIIVRMVSQITKIPLNNLRKNILSNEELFQCNNTFDYLYKSNFNLIDSNVETIQDIESIVRKYNNESHIDVLIIDYLTLLDLPKGEKKVDQIGEITRRLKLLAKKENICVILLSQLNRNVEDRTNKIPCLADLRDSGNIEQDADMVYLIYRKEQEGLITENGKIIVAKNRNGPIGVMPFRFNSDNVLFDFNVGLQ